jgi:hypothetical protein
MAEIRTKDGSLYVYTHSYGMVFDEMAEEAIAAAAPRWNDQDYAARIIVDQITKPGRDSEVGFGLMLEPNAEDEYHGGATGDRPSIIINLVARTLTVYNDHVHLDEPVGKTFAEIA